jgi:hypothetical protein
MVKAEIVGGLKTALARGETLQKAMMSFYNSGYAKQDIEDAARALESPNITQVPQTRPITQPAQQPSPRQVLRPATPGLNPTMQRFPQPSQQYNQQSQKPIQRSIQQPRPSSEPKKPSESGEQVFDVPEPTYPPEGNQQGTKEEFPPLEGNTQTVQKVSKYGGKPSPLGAVVVFVLVFFLLFLIGILISLFLFKDQLTLFFNKFIG